MNFVRYGNSFAVFVFDFDVTAFATNGVDLKTKSPECFEKFRSIYSVRYFT